MTWEPRPTPTVTPETAPYWRAAADGRLLLQRCADCDRTYHYPRGFCPDCLSGDVEWLEADGTGSVYAYSATERAEGWPEERLPLVTAYVELDEGPRLLTNLVDCDPAAVAVGTRVSVRFVPTADDEVAIPVFALEE
jgi:hypothetical protein